MIARLRTLRALLAAARTRPDLAWRAVRRLWATRDLQGVWLRILHVAQASRPTPLARPYFHLDDTAHAALVARARRAEVDGPTISVVIPFHHTPPAFLRAAIASVLDQPYRRLEVVLVDDADRITPALAQAQVAAQADGRVLLLRMEARGGVSHATNFGVAAARGEVVTFLDHDDELTVDALTVLAERFAADPAVDVFYSDQVKIDERGEVVDHQFKPDWSPLHMLGVMYVGHLLAVRRPWLRAVGGFDPTLDGVQDFDLVLRLHEAEACFGHIPAPLYKWRACPGSLAAAPDAKPDIVALQQKAVSAHLLRRGLTWTVEPHPTHGPRHRLRVSPSPKTPAPAVSVVIPSRDQGEAVTRCLGSIRRLTRHPAYEIVLVDDATTDALALDAFDRFGVRRIDGRRPFNFSAACNLGARAARGGLVLFLNNDTEVTNGDWLRQLSLWFENPTVGAVGPVLTYPDGRVQHAGVVLGARGTADHAMRGFDARAEGYAGALCAAREVSAVTAACMMMRRADFAGMGGFSTDFATHYQDVDLSLRLRASGFSVVCTPTPTLIHHEGMTRGSGYDFGDRALFIDRWREDLAKPDPFYSAWFDREKLNYAVAG